MFVKMCDLDTVRHKLGVDSDTAKLQLEKHDCELGVLMESIRRYGDFEHTNFVVMGDHGQTDVSQVLNFNRAFQNAGLQRLDENGKLDFYQLYRWIYEREIMNMKITTDEGFTLLIWNSEMQADGQGFESRPYFYRDANPDLFMYQVAGASFDYDRRNPNCQHMGEWIASVKGRTALPEHQQHFSYDELDAVAEKFSDIC